MFNIFKKNVVKNVARDTSLEERYEKLIVDSEGRVFNSEYHFSLRKNGISVEIMDDEDKGVLVGLIDNVGLSAISVHLDMEQIEKLHETLGLMLEIKSKEMLKDE